jgi:hypothetical protein
VGRHDGPDTAWNRVESITAWLYELEEALRDVILESESQADLAPIIRWADAANITDTVVTFNYDTLAELALSGIGKKWNHGTGREGDDGITICKLHGSIDWIVAHRLNQLSNLDLLFDKANLNRSEKPTGSIEDDCVLWRCRNRDQLNKWMSRRDFQYVRDGASPQTVGIAGLGAYKQLHVIPGLGHVWARGMRALYEAKSAIIVGFSMSDFDKMAQMHFAEVARKRHIEGRPLRVTVIDPGIQQDGEQRFLRVFRTADFIKTAHQDLDWNDV